MFIASHATQTSLSIFFKCKSIIFKNCFTTLNFQEKSSTKYFMWINCFFLLFTVQKRYRKPYSGLVAKKLWIRDNIHPNVLHLYIKHILNLSITLPENNVSKSKTQWYCLIMVKINFGMIPILSIIRAMVSYVCRNYRNMSIKTFNVCVKMVNALCLSLWWNCCWFYRA